MTGCNSYYDITINQGSDFNLSLILKDGFGNLINLSGYSGVSVIQDKFGTGPSGVLGYFNISFPTPASGTLNLNLPWTGSSGINSTQARYCVDLIAPDLTHTRYLQGYLYLMPDLNYGI